MIAAMMKLANGDALFNEVQSDHDLFLLVDGHLDVFASYSGPKASRNVLLGAVDREVFGEVAWCLKCERTAVITCRKKAVVLRIDGNALDAYLEENHEVGFELTRRVLGILARKLVNNNKLLRMIMQNSFVV